MTIARKVGVYFFDGGVCGDGEVLPRRRRQNNSTIIIIKKHSRGINGHERIIDKKPSIGEIDVRICD